MKTLSDRLNYAMQQTGKTQTEVARGINVKPQVIQYICSHNVEKSKFTYLIADLLDIDPIWLATGKGEFKTLNQESLQNNDIKVPLLTYEEIKNAIKNEEKITTLKTESYVYSRPIGSNNQLFAIKLKDKSMYPRFDEGTLIIIDLSNMPKDGDFSLVYIKSQDDLVFRQIVQASGNIALVPINLTSYKTLKLEKQDIILGVCKEARMNF